MKTNRTGNRRRRRLVLWAVAAVAVIAIGFGAFTFWFLRDDAPQVVSLDNAVTQVVDDTTGDDTTNVSSAADTADADTGEQAVADDSVTVGAASLDGSWAVDTTVGEFSYDDSTGTFVGFRIEENLSGIGSTTAVGRTPTVTGTLTVDGTTITAVSIEADMTATTTNDSRRDDEVQRALETDQYPTATFVLTAPIELDAAALAGEQTTVSATGGLTIHGVTRTVTLALQTQLVDDTVVVVGSTDIIFADYGVTVPSAPIVVSAEDHGLLELQLFFSR